MSAAALAGGAVREIAVRAQRGRTSSETLDRVAVEEPLEIRIARRSLAITMRTPGHDAELAVGFLLGEGIVRTAADIATVVADPTAPNVIDVTLAPGVVAPFERLTRHFYATSSCGVCGKASLEAVLPRRPPGAPVIDLRANPLRVPVSTLYAMPATLRDAQVVFDRTGGLHAAGLFDVEGRLIELREDVGRHNAVDKIVGASARAGRWPLTESVLLVSGRASFELVQKAWMAGVPMLAAVGAPSSLAVDLARETGMTLVGFVRDERCNVYASPERVLEGS